MQNTEPIPEEFQDGYVAPPASVTLSPIEEAQQKLKELEEQQSSFSLFNSAQSEPENRPLTVAEMMAKGVASQAAQQQPQPVEQSVVEPSNEAKTLVDSVLEGDTNDAVLVEPEKDEEPVEPEEVGVETSVETVTENEQEEVIIETTEKPSVEENNEAEVEAVAEDEEDKELEPEFDEEVEEDEEAEEEEQHVHIGRVFDFALVQKISTSKISYKLKRLE